MQPTPEPLDLVCPKCSLDLKASTKDLGPDPLTCPHCGFRVDLDQALFEDALLESWPDEMDARLR